MKKSESSSTTNALPARRSRGRPRSFDRNEALKVATRLFWLKGYEGTSIADLTSEIGIEAPSLYAAFGTKQDLYEAAIRYYGDNYGALVWGNFEAAGTAREAIWAYLSDSAMALSGADADLPRGCMATLSTINGQPDDPARDFGRAARASTFDRLVGRIAMAVQAGELPRSVDASGLARYIQDLQSGMSVLARDGADRAQLDCVARIAMFAWDGFISSVAGDNGG